MIDPVTMNHPDLPGQENAVVERDAYRGTWYAKGWRSADDPGYVGQSDPPVPRTVGSHEVRYHGDYILVPGNFGKNRWFAARDEGAIRRVKGHFWGDSIFQGAGCNLPRTDGCIEKIINFLQTNYGDGGTGWVPAAYTCSTYRLTITGTPTGGSVTLNVSVNGGGSQAAVIPYNSNAAAVQTLIQALSNVGVGNVKVSDGALPGTAVAIVFQGTLAHNNVAVTAGANSLTGGTAPNFTVLNPWTPGMGMGGSQYTATGPAAMHFANMRGTQGGIFHRNANITGSFRWRMDGGSWNTVTPPTAFGQDPALANFGTVANTAHTVDIEWLSGTVSIFGVEVSRATGFVPFRFAQSGRAASDYFYGRHRKIPGGTSPDRGISGTNASPTITAPAPGFFTNDMIGQFVTGPAQIPVGTTITAVASATSATMSANATGSFSTQAAVISDKGVEGVVGANFTADPFLAEGIGQPDLVVIQLGANDPAGANNDAVTTRDGLSKIARLYTQRATLDFTPDFVFGIEHMGDWFDIEAEFTAVAGSIAQVAVGNGAAIVDIWGKGRRSWKYWNDLGYFADSIHPSPTGHTRYAEEYISVLSMTDN